MSKDGGSSAGERTMSATEFRAKCLGLMDEVAATGREIVITKRGRPVAQLRPIRPVRKSLFGRDRDIIKIHGDITAPIDVEWDAETGKNWVEPLVLGRDHKPESAASQRPDCRGDGSGGVERVD